MSTVNGLSTALRLYQSDKIKERGQGLEQLREIFSNRENVNLCQETYKKEGGAGWVAFFQCLFQVVVMEKKAVVKRGASAQADKRLADSISLVRWMTERTVHLISRKPFLALFTHMTQLLVFSSQIFPPAALDYAKALRTLLSYPPHLENLDQASWKILMGICWAAVLGDNVRIDDDWDDGNEVEDEDEDMEQNEIVTTQAASGPSKKALGRSTISQINNELVSLVPILLSSSSAPLLPPLPTKDISDLPTEKVGFSLLLKIHRFFHQYPNETSAHLPVLRSLNVVLTELELSCRDDFVSAGLKLIPQLTSLWGTRNKALREQVVIALRMILPFVTHKSLVDSKQAMSIRETLEKLVDGLSRETTTKWGIEPIDLSVLRLRTMDSTSESGSFELRGIGAGFDFGHEQAMAWAVLELYRDACLYLYDSHSLSHPATPSREGPSSKRRRIENALTSLISATDTGSPKSRLLALQVLIFFSDKHFNKVHSEAQVDVRRAMIELLDDDDESLQTWAFVGLALLAQLSYERHISNEAEPSNLLDSPSSRLAERRSEEGDWKKVWVHALRKASTASTCRSACHVAVTIMHYDKLDQAQVIKDIHAFLQNVDIQGPIFPYDSICTFLSLALDRSRSDVRLYSLELEDKVLAWTEKCNLMEGPRGSGRLEQLGSSDVLKLLSSIARFQKTPLSGLTTIEVLPDAAVVDRILEEAKTKTIRDYLLYAILPGVRPRRDVVAMVESEDAASTSESLAYLEGRPRRISTYLNSTMKIEAATWESQGGSAVPPDRVRKCLDLVVLALGYQATIQLNGYMPDPDCTHSAIQMLASVRPYLAASGMTIPARHLVWRALEPLVHSDLVEREDWPVLIKPDAESGIRQDLLPTTFYDSPPALTSPTPNCADVRQDSATSQLLPTQSLKPPSQIPASGLVNFPLTPISPVPQLQPPRSASQKLVNCIWQLPTVTAAFKDVFELCRSIIDHSDTANTVNGTHTPTSGLLDDDDFGEIRTAETDIMPLSKEAMECHRTSASLLRTVIGFRLRGLMLASNAQKPYKDPQLINSMSRAEGSRCVEIGNALCFAIENSWLRLGIDAVDLIEEVFEDMLSSFAYSRDENLLCLALEFARCSLSVWMPMTGSISELGSRMMNVVAHIASRIDKGLIGSWKVRMGILRFLDDFLHYDSAKELWQEALGEIIETENPEEDLDPLSYLSGSLVDIDTRVRIRAATSASSVFYRPLITPHGHKKFYFSALFKQPGDNQHFDSFVVHLLWKLNCCIATADQRSATVFHLYEIPATSPSFNQHLQSGLEAVARRLGLTSISSLYLPYALVIIRSQLQEGQLAMRIPHRLYGYHTRKAYSLACLARVGPAILAAREADFFVAACEAANVAVDVAVMQAFPSVAAIAFAQAFGEDRPVSDAARVAIETLTHLPGLDTAEEVTSILEAGIDGVAAHLWELVDLGLSFDDMGALLDKVDRTQSSGKIYADLIVNEMALPESSGVVDPSSSAAEVVSAYRYISKQYPSLSLSKMVFNAILRLTTKINDNFLVREQRRHLRALALVVALHQEEFRHPTILQAYIRETLALLPQHDICNIVVSMVAWGFGQLDLLTAPITNLVDLFIQLGTARVTLDNLGDNAKEVGNGLESWIISSATVWNTSNAVRPTFEAALALWPDHLRQKLSESYTPLFTDLVTLSEGGTVKNAGELCKQYLRIVRTGTRPEAINTFVQSLFWQLKDKMSVNTDQEGINAFLEVLFCAHGQVHAPPLESMAMFSTFGSGQQSSVASYKIAKDPDGALRAAMLEEVAKLTDDADHSTRGIAYRVLQGMLPMVTDLLVGSVLPPQIIAQLSVLTPIHLSTVPTSKEGNLDGAINDFNWVKKARSVTTWVKEFVKMLCETVIPDDPFYNTFEPLLSAPGVSLRPLLPHLVQAALTCGAAKHQTITVKRAKIISDHFAVVLQWPSTSNDTIRSILDTVLHLRHSKPLYRNGELGYNAWLEVDFIILSGAAAKCGAYATALLFLELSRDQERPNPVELSDSNVQKVMYEIYSNVEDPDGFYGIQNHDVRDALLRRLEHEGESSRAFSWNGAAIETTARSSQSFLPTLHNLHSFGFNRLASSIAFSSRPQQTEMEDDPFFFELAWRTGDWDLPVSEESAKTSQGLLYSALRAVHRERNSDAVLKVVNHSIGLEMERLGQLGMERMAQIKRTATNLLCLREAAHWLNTEFQASLESGISSTSDNQISEFGNLDRAFEFVNAEKLTATRLSLLQSARHRESKNMIGDLLTPKMETLNSLEKACHLRLGEMARSAGNLQAAINSVTAIQQLELGSDMSDRAQDAFSHVLWEQKEHGLAIQHTSDQAMQVRGRRPADPARLAVLLGRMGHWTSMAKLKAAHEIRPIFDEAHILAMKHKINIQEQAQIYYEYAKFADSHYAILSKSSELERLRTYRDRKSLELSSTTSSSKSTRRESGVRPSRVAQEVEEDAQAIKKLELELLTFIKLALRMYGSAIGMSDAYDDSVTQLCSLWLQHDENEEVNKHFSGPLSRIPTHKFIFLGPQLAARLYRPTLPTAFSSNLNGLMLRMSQQHPFHILYQIITLAHGVHPPTSAKRKSTDAENQGRGPAAAEILAVLAMDEKYLRARQASKEMKVFVEASVLWSRFEERSGSSQSTQKPKAGSTHNLPTNCPLKSLRLDIPIATVPPPIDHTMQYTSIPTFMRYRSTYTIAGGVHRPKIMKCYDSLSKVHQQLFKADDEVRQDAVMEQVFTMTNDLLSRDRQAQTRDLKFRTYNVVPLPERTGIIEFVEGTRGIGEWLKPAHLKYRNGIDITPAEFQGKISKIQDRDPNSADLVKQYNTSMKQFHPVMRHFFVEKHKDPMAWFAMRLNYSRSVAVTSIVGWMVGLGDRHCSNILIDQSSGELVHIDFGIVFEEGRRLRIPEKVPFRLTNDLVDGLGITGVEGTFRRCAEHTLRVLRDASSLVLTVLEVFKHDPLYAWAGDPDKLQRAQGGGRVDLISHDANVQEKADRVLGKIKDKLAGGLSVEYTVNMLIQEARDVESLAKIYHGWAAWF